jgi:hypothetical protein
MAESMLPPDFEAQLEAAAARGGERAGWEPRAEAVRYDAEEGWLVVKMAEGPSVLLPVQDIAELRSGTPRELAQVALRPGGTAITCPPLDADIYVPGLLADALGLTRWWKHQRAAEAGSVSSVAKASSSRQNGRRGGRPAHVTGHPEPVGTLLATAGEGRAALEIRAGSEYVVGGTGTPAQRGRKVVALRWRGERDGRIEARFTDTGKATLVEPAALEAPEVRLRASVPLLKVAEPREEFGSDPSDA